jgi:hypothetical protein
MVILAILKSVWDNGDCSVRRWLQCTPVTAVYVETFEQLQRLKLKAEVTRATKIRDYETIQFLFLVCLAVLSISETTQRRNTVIGKWANKFERTLQEAAVANCGIFRNLPRRGFLKKLTKTWVSVFGFLAEIRTRHIPITSRNCYRLSQGCTNTSPTSKF